MKLYSLQGSRYGSRCAIQIAAKGLPIPVEILPVPLPERLWTMNPAGLVPVLEVDGRFIPESQVICEFLEDLGEGPSLRPADPLERARMRLAIRQFELYFDPPLLEIYGYLRGGGEMPRDRIAPLREKIAKALAMIVAPLDEGMYAIGSSLTLADCALMPPFFQIRLLFPRLGFADPIAENPKAETYFEQTKADPHVAAVLEHMEPPLIRWYDAARCV